MVFLRLSPTRNILERSTKIPNRKSSRESCSSDSRDRDLRALTLLTSNIGKIQEIALVHLAAPSSAVKAWETSGNKKNETASFPPSNSNINHYNHYFCIHPEVLGCTKPKLHWFLNNWTTPASSDTEGAAWVVPVAVINHRLSGCKESLLSFLCLCPFRIQEAIHSF